MWLLERKADVTEQHMGHSFWAGGGKAMVGDIELSICGSSLP